MGTHQRSDSIASDTDTAETETSDHEIPTLAEPITEQDIDTTAVSSGSDELAVKETPIASRRTSSNTKIPAHPDTPPPVPPLPASVMADQLPATLSSTSEDQDSFSSTSSNRGSVETHSLHFLPDPISDSSFSNPPSRPGSRKVSAELELPPGVSLRIRRRDHSHSGSQSGSSEHSIYYHTRGLTTSTQATDIMLTPSSSSGNRSFQERTPVKVRPRSRNGKDGKEKELDYSMANMTFGQIA